jgi:hypothetical protein
MIDLTKFSETTKTVTFTNGKTLKIYSQETKKGLRYYYYSMPRMIQISSQDIK